MSPLGDNGRGRCGHHVFTDRYYTSVELAQELHRHTTTITGTCNKNRKELPDEIRSLGRMEGGELRAY